MFDCGRLERRRTGDLRSATSRDTVIPFDLNIFPRCGVWQAECNKVSDGAWQQRKLTGLGGISVEGRFALNTVVQRTNSAVVAAPEGMTELVRGSDQRLVWQVEPMVRDKDIILNCQNIERIDAAGIAALISLYGSAISAGHSFHVCNVKAHVQEVLSIVGLERILVVCCWNSPTHTAMTQTAA